ncbi:phosphoribosylformylglycinamidine synthase subunit PurQ [Weissella uvarum]|uniref:phosphoribosylformylglycinamidine synthase subunit PurQ n=1 Tax=Weissella uvarum TaxID=1479233 RepID=UPI00195F2D68|nr:phosphoribosylformylglycinamidine synthase subunit PurQ [Weissella uvarum]
MKTAVVRFPGSNCDEDLFYALADLNLNPVFVSAQEESDLSDYAAIFLPGGFSYGDYLRTGAIARFSPIMDAVRHAADAGQLVVGICNGFQILTESGLLPGQLMQNATPGFICDEVMVNITNPNSAFTRAYTSTSVKLPIAHADGRYYADAATLQELVEHQQIILTYQDNVNGSVEQIAGITNVAGNVIGLMPHPERAMEALIGNVDGRGFFESIQASLPA